MKASEDKVVFEQDTLNIQTNNQLHPFTIEIAKSQQQLKQGLMFREKMRDNEAMLFDFGEEQKISMWMKNTLISLDMLFIDNSGKIIYIAHQTKPNTLETISPSHHIARAVLEVNAGTAKKLGIQINDKIIYKAFAQ